MHPPTLSLAIRVNHSNHDHHLWRNHGVCWVHYMVHEEHRKRRVRSSLGTRDLVEARAARDAVFARLEVPSCGAAAQIDPAIVIAYRETDYRILGPTPFTLHIDEVSAALVALHREHGASFSTFVTACNPFSQSLSDTQNAARHEALREELCRRQLRCFEGAGQHPTNGWPPEASFLVLGLDLAAARELGNRWQQNAIVWNGADAVPQLILLR